MPNPTMETRASRTIRMGTTALVAKSMVYVSNLRRSGKCLVSPRISIPASRPPKLVHDFPEIISFVPLENAYIGASSWL